MGVALQICSNSVDDPEYGPASYIKYHEQREEMQIQRFQGSDDQIDIAKVAFESLMYDVENFLFPPKQDEEELNPDDMTQE